MLLSLKKEGNADTCYMPMSPEDFMLRDISSHKRTGPA